MKKKNLQLTELEIQNLEKKFPEFAQISIKQAYFKALSSGSSVLVVENGKLLEVFPDGCEKIIKEIEPNIAVKKGAKFEIL